VGDGADEGVAVAPGEGVTDAAGDGVAVCDGCGEGDADEAGRGVGDDAVVGSGVALAAGDVTPAALWPAMRGAGGTLPPPAQATRIGSAVTTARRRKRNAYPYRRARGASDTRLRAPS
jgi:hypothetical protein